MKQLKHLPALSILFFTIVMNSCDSADKQFLSERNERAETSRVSVRNDRIYDADAASYSRKEEFHLKANDVAIASLKAALNTKSNIPKAAYSKQLDELASRNNELCKQIHNCNTEDKEAWAHFKMRFDSDICQLSADIADLSTPSIK